MINVNVLPNGKWMTLELKNDHCLIRAAEPNNHIIYRLIKNAVKLQFRTIGKRIKKRFNK